MKKISSILISIIFILSSQSAIAGSTTGSSVTGLGGMCRGSNGVVTPCVANDAIQAETVVTTGATPSSFTHISTVGSMKVGTTLDVNGIVTLRNYAGQINTDYVTLNSEGELSVGVPSGGSGIGITLPFIDPSVAIFNNASSNYRLDVNADQQLLVTTGYKPHIVTSVDLTIDINDSGANGLDTGSEAVSTWYHAYVIYNSSTVAGLFSTSATAPTMPSGYTYKAYVGAIYNDASGNFYTIHQQGNEARIESIIIVNTTNWSNSFTGVSTANAIPVTARIGIYLVSMGGTTRCSADFSPNSTGTLGNVSVYNYSIRLNAPIEVMQITQNLYYREVNNGTETIGQIDVTGWKF